jgi:hypothetical protein
VLQEGVYGDKRWVTGEKTKMDSENISNGSHSNLHVIGCLSQSFRSFPAIRQRQPMCLCGNSIVSTRRRRNPFLFVCFDAHCTIDANVRQVFGLWRALTGFNWTDAGNIMSTSTTMISQSFSSMSRHCCTTALGLPIPAQSAAC